MSSGALMSTPPAMIMPHKNTSPKMSLVRPVARVNFAWSLSKVNAYRYSFQARVNEKIVIETDTKAVLLIQVRYGYLLNRSENARSDRSVEKSVGVRLKLRLGG